MLEKALFMTKLLLDGSHASFKELLEFWVQIQSQICVFGIQLFNDCNIQIFCYKRQIFSIS